MPPVAKNICGKNRRESALTINVENLEREAIRGIDADVDLKTDISSVAFLNFYLKDVPMVRLEEGAGTLAVKLKMQKGLIKKAQRGEARFEARRRAHAVFFCEWIWRRSIGRRMTKKPSSMSALKDIAITQES